MNHSDELIIERAVKAHLRCAASFGYSPMLPSTGSSERTGNVVTLHNRNGTLARYKVRKLKTTGAEYRSPQKQRSPRVQRP